VSDKEDITVDDLLGALHRVLIEIRATDNLRLAKTLSDIFHNAPGAIARNDPERGFEDLMRTARRLNSEALAKSILDHEVKKRKSQR